jgi:hypothetical protein
VAAVNDLKDRAALHELENNARCGFQHSKAPHDAGVVDGDQVAAKFANDPKGLLNPGKLKGYMEAIARD